MAEAPRSTVRDLALDANDGSPLVPSNPDVAQSRLAELEADPVVVDALMNPMHPMHKLRSMERKGLLVVIARGRK
jgi:hypothetical protein